MASDDAMDVETATQGLYMDVEQQVTTNAGSPAESPRSSSNETPGEQVQPRANDGHVPAEIADIILMARRVLVAFMRERKAEDIVPDNSRVVVVDGNVRLRYAFRALLENGVRAAPVIDTSTHQFCGMVSVSDILGSLLHLYYLQRSEDVSHDLSAGLNEYTVSSWHQQKRQQRGAEDGTLSTEFRYADADGTLFDAVRIMRDGRVPHVPILSRERTLLHTLEHWRVLRFLHRHFTSEIKATDVQTGQSMSDPQDATRLFNLTLSQLNLGTYSGLITIPTSSPLLGCLQTLQQHGLSALPVVDERKQLIEVYSRADVALLSGGVCDGNVLQRSVGEVLTGVRGGAPFAAATCRKEDILGTVLEQFERTGVQRLYIVGEAGLEGVVSLGDLLQYFLCGF